MSVQEEFPGITSVLRFFAETRRFGVLDRIGMAMSPTAVKEAVYEALRTIKALEAKSVTVKLRVDGNRVYTFKCCEYGEPDRVCGGVVGVVDEVLEGSGVGRGSRIACIKCPRLPDESELKRFFEILDKTPLKGLELAKMLASKAFAREG